MRLEFTSLVEVKDFLEEAYSERFSLNELEESLNYGTIFTEEEEINFFYDEDLELYALEKEDF